MSDFVDDIIEAVIEECEIIKKHTPDSYISIHPDNYKKLKQWIIQQFVDRIIKETGGDD